MSLESRRRTDSFTRDGWGPARPPDYTLMVIVVLLLLFGLIMVYSASVVDAYTKYGNRYFFLGRQVLAAVLGVLVMLVLTRVDYRWLRRVSLVGFVATLATLVIVMLPGAGKEVHGAQRWIPLGAFQFQPSEFAKVALVVYVSHWLADKREDVRSFSHGLLPLGILLTIMVALLLWQRDLGTSVVMVVTAISIYFVSGANLLHLFALGIIGACGMVMAVVLEPYRLARWLTFLDPWSNPQSSGYHMVQALLALGSGGWMGAGLGVGRQKFNFLPFPHTDSIFAVIGEELGLAGTVALLILIIWFASRGLRIARLAPDMFGRLLAMGITSGITFQALINMGVLTSSLPFTGITLPFISYGGSSLLATLAGCGILMGISRHITVPANGTDSHARHHFWWRNGRPYLPGFGRGSRLAGRPG